MKHTKKRGYVFIDNNSKRIVTDWRGRRRRRKQGKVEVQ